MKFFDFHIHPALKPQFNTVEKRDSPWTTLKFGFDIIDSQSSFSQLKKGQVKLVGLVLHAPEQNMAKGLLDILESEDFFIKVFKKLAGGLFNRVTEKVNTGRLEEIKTGEKYFSIINQELENIQNNLTDTGGSSARIKILRSKEDYEEDNLNNIYCFLLVEGAHCFFGAKPITSTEGWEEFIGNIESFTSTNRILVLNPAHIQFNNLVNHSFAIKMFKETDFYPQGLGFIPPEKRMYDFIDLMELKKIMIDIKHMSYVSRRRLFSYRKGKEMLPVVCTHAGVSGVSIKDLSGFTKRPFKKGSMYKQSYYKKLGWVPRTSFNLSSINLYDEDIIDVLLSGGMIGISLDRRIAGYTDYYPLDIITDVEYLTEEEKTALFGHNPRFGNDDEIFNTDTLTQDDLRNYPMLDLRYFLNQVFHIIQVATAHGIREKAINQICIGSDFDGMIEAMWCCKTAEEMPVFYELAQRHFKEIAIESAINIDGLDNLIDKIFFENGKNFILKYI